MRLSLIPQEVAVAAVEMALKPLIEQGIVTVQPGNPTLYGIEQVWLSRCAQAGPRMRAVIPSFDLT